jgi:hypothetical protein
MYRDFLSIRGVLVLAAALAVLLLASGCGSSDSASGGEVSVQTGSLSKAAFIKRADAICAANRNQFNQDYAAFLRSELPKSSNSDQNALRDELVETVLLPNYGKDVDEISALGAPSGDEGEVSSFLKSLQQRLDELGEKPSELSNKMFVKPAKLAGSYGLAGCVKSLIG